MTQTDITCPSCKSHFFVQSNSPSSAPHYCSFCGQSLADTSEVSLVKGHAPSPEEIKFTIGAYQILDTIGMGGMGEVFLAYDTSCGRRIALKRVRTDLDNRDILLERFLKEARINSQLTHPAIIPIYAIHVEGDVIYYTMPYVEGETLKQLLRKTRRQEKKGERLDHIGGSIPALTRIMITICQAVSYSHNNFVLHRDLKPENIILGKYGEVLILDWGLAKIVDSPAMHPSTRKQQKKGTFTTLGKVVGTVTYMAPERAMGESATVQTDIYSLGVILYQMLTLHSPFRRESIEDFRKNMHREVFTDPSEIAPYRDVPKILSQVCQRCLATNPEERYLTVEDLIRDLENYIEGRSEWFRMAKLDIKNKKVWEFQENVLIAEHVAITRSAEVSDWVSLMISKSSFTDNVLLEAKVKIKENGHGIGFLMSIPEAGERTHLNDGYCLWLGTDNHPATKLLRSTVEVVSYPEISLKRNVSYHIKIEKVDNRIQLYLNNTLQMTYISHAPVVGKHVGLLSRDADFEIKDFYVSIGGHMATVSCLAIPDAFLAHKEYDRALNEYRRIGSAFPGRAEGRDALFRAGITLLEKAKDAGSEAHIDEALTEFDKLHNTPGAPLEYLGKALVYRYTKDYEEEIKCYTLAFRRYPKHPLLPLLSEQVVARMHETSRFHRNSTYNLIYLAVRHLPNIDQSQPSQRLFDSLKNHWEPLSFMEKDSKIALEKSLSDIQFSLELAFWLAKPFHTLEILNELFSTKTLHLPLLKNGIYSLFELGSTSEGKKWIEKLENPDTMAYLAQSLNTSPIYALKTMLDSTVDFSSFDTQRTIFYLMEQALLEEQFSSVISFAKKLKEEPLPGHWKLTLNCFHVWAALSLLDKEESEQILHEYPLDILTKETSLLYFLYGCWLRLSEGEEIAKIHFSASIDISFPRTWSLGAHSINGTISSSGRWFDNSFLWERRHLYHQLSLYSICSGDEAKAKEYKLLEREEYIHVSE